VSGFFGGRSPDNIGTWVNNESLSNGQDIAVTLAPGDLTALARGVSGGADGGEGPVTIRGRRE
jgi:hypothetical protein